MEDKDIKLIEEFNHNFLSASRIGLNFPVTMYIDDDTHNAIMKLLQAYKQDEKVIQEMAKYMVQEFAEYQLDNIYAELYNCNGMERNWTRGSEEEIKDILKYFRKKCE